MKPRDEQVWRRGLARRRHARPQWKPSRHYPRYRVPRMWNAMPWLKVGVVLVLILLAIRLAI